MDNPGRIFRVKQGRLLMWVEVVNKPFQECSSFCSKSGKPTTNHICFGRLLLVFSLLEKGHRNQRLTVEQQSQYSMIAFKQSCH